jgi:hypothetical protein
MWRIAIGCYPNFDFDQLGGGDGRFTGTYTLGIRVLPQVQLVPHRTGDFQGQEVTDEVKNGKDPSQYLILTDNDYVLSDGTPALAADTAEIPGIGSSGGDADLAKITLKQLPHWQNNGTLKIILSDPKAVRLFKSDGSLLYEDGTTGAGVLTLDLSSPSGYLAGLESSDLDVWVEGVHKVPDFDFALLYEDDQGRVVAHDDVHMTIAEWTFCGYDGTPLYDVEPIWEQALLAALQEATSLGIQGQVSEIPEDYFYKNAIIGLPGGIQAQLQVTSDDDPSETYIDDLMQVSEGFISRYFAALYGSEEILDADPDPELTPSQRQEILSILGLNVVHNPGQETTLTTGPAGNPTDSHTRKLTIKKDFTITLNDADGIYDAGEHINGTVSVENRFGWSFTVLLEDRDGKVVQSTHGGNPTSFDFVVAQPGYYVVSVLGMDPLTAFGVAGASGGFNNGSFVVPKNSVLIRVLSEGDAMSTWELQAWQALFVNGAVPGDPINLNRQITTLYALMYNDQSANLMGPDSKTVFKWSGMAALASYLVGSGMAKAQLALDTAGIFLLTAPDPGKGIQLLSRGNLDVFMDMYPQMLAYRSGRMTKIQDMLNDGSIRKFQFDAWQQINQGQTGGNLDLVWDGNQGLLKFEQQVTLQRGAYAADPAYWKTLTNHWNWFVPPVYSPIPSDPSTFQSFRIDTDAADVPDDASIGEFNARWAWIVRRQLWVYRMNWSHPTIDIKKLLSGGYKSF